MGAKISERGTVRVTRANCSHRFCHCWLFYSQGGESLNELIIWSHKIILMLTMHIEKH